MSPLFSDFDLANFWEPSSFATETYIDFPLTDEELRAIEATLGYRLPQSYIELCRSQNGGIPRKTNHRTLVPSSWADDHIAITGICAIGHRKSSSLCGEFGSQFMIAEWGYPNIGVYFADCPSAGHDMICLDYRSCDRNGEPQVVHVDQECDYEIIFVAPSFESFIRGLEGDEIFDIPA